MIVDRLLFTLRRRAPELSRLLGSWRLSVVLMVLGALYYALLAIWATSTPPAVVGNIARLLPFWVVGALMLVNTWLCFWRRLPALKRSFSRQPAALSRQPDWTGPSREGLEADLLRSALRRAGYRITDLADGSVGGVRGRLAGLGSYLFHGSFFIIGAAVLLTATMRVDATLRVAEGETYTGAAEQVISISRPRLIALGLPKLEFTVVAVEPELWDQQLLFTSLEAELIMAGGRHVSTRINRPLWLGWSTFVRLSGFGYAPRYELLDRDGQVHESLFVKLVLFPPGQVDTFDLDRFPHRVSLEVFPDARLRHGRVVMDSFNLRNPLIGTQVTRGRLPLAEADLRIGERIEFEGLALRFPEIRYWGDFAVIRDPGLPVLLIGFAAALLGLGIKLRGQRIEVRWEGDPLQGGRLEVWGSARLPGGLTCLT